MDVREIDIEAPWGKIAIKLWGNEDDPPVLAVHGIMDNAGSFDGIIPLVPKFFYICVDLPGHGKSSHFPPHLPIFSVNYLIVYTLVMDYFKKDKCIIMGHSYGGQIGLLFAQVYPERVEKLIMFDTVHMFPVPSHSFAKYLADKYSQLSAMERKMKTNSAPQYTYEEAFDKLMEARPSPLTERSAKALLERMLVPVENGKFQLSLDQRLKFYITPLHDDRYILETLKESSVKCPVLMIFGLDNGGQRQILRPILHHLKKQKNFTVKYVPGHHDVHQTDPELVAPYVETFLLLQKSKL